MKFTREVRMRSASDFRYVFARPDVIRDRYFKVLSRVNGLQVNRLGLAVSARTCRKAAGRNRLKRLIRESFRLHQTLLPSELPRDYVVLPQREAVLADNAPLLESLRRHWCRGARRSGQNDKP